MKEIKKLNLKTKNSVIVSGEITNIYETNKSHLLVRIKVQMDNIEIFICDDKNVGIIKNYYSVGDNITILGNIQSSVFVGGSPSKMTTSIFAEYILGRTFSLKDTACFRLEGIVKKVIKREKYTKVLLTTYKNGRPSVVPVVYYINNGENINVSPGEYLFVKGTVQIRRRVLPDGKKEYHQNYVAEL